MRLPKIDVLKFQTIVFLFCCIHTTAQDQNPEVIKTSVPCTDDMAQKEKGRWIKSTDIGSYNSKETNTRLDEIQNMILKIYPQPTGIDAVWHRAAGVSYFGAKRKYSQTANGLRSEDTGLPPFIKYYYRAGFFRYRCEYNKTNSLQRGYPGETGTWLTITANEAQGAIGPADGGDWTINGLPVRTRPPAIKTIRGYEVQHGEPGSNIRYVLIHRNNVLPYIPVSRKQYLDHCIIYHTKVWDELIQRFSQLPVRSLEEQEKEKNVKLAKFEKDFGKDPKRLKSTVDYYLSGYKTDQQMRDEQVAKAKKNKEQELKKFTDELEKTTIEGLLDTPAMILVMMLSGPIFETDPLKANMVVIENPAYIRKDLPKHIPQLFVVEWSWSDWAPQKRLDEIMEQDFPFEKLQAMIDK